MMNATYRVSYDTEMWNGTLGVECFGKVSIFKPYIGAGGGIYYVRTITQADRQSGDIGRESDKGTWALGGNLVAGLRAPVRTNLTLDVNVQYDRVSDVEAFTETFEDTHFEFQSISVFVGIYYRLLFPWK